jgi:hypothetical protein
VAVVQGYNSNTYQAQDDPNVPIIRRHPSPYTGLDGSLELRLAGRGSDGLTLVLGGRFNHFEPLQPEVQSDDGGANGLLTGHLTLGPRTGLQITNSGTITSFNASHVTDGTVFAFDPTQIQSTYWVDDFNLSFDHELSPTMRLTQAIGVSISGTLSSSPTQLTNSLLVEHRGLDYVLPYIQTAINKDFSDRSTGDLSLLYQYSYALFVLDLTQHPPRNIGPAKQAFLTALAGYTYRLSPELSVAGQGGFELASAPPRDIDQRAMLGPAASGQVYFARPFFNVTATVGYSYGTVNPRLGAGPAVAASVLAVGVPYHVGNWQNFAVIGTVQTTYSSLVTGVDQSTKLGLYAGGVQARYGFSDWLGVVAGWDVRYAVFDTIGYEPPFFQTIVFVGLSGFWTTDRAQPPITNFAAPVQPPA